jgi:hypothetical protein
MAMFDPLSPEHDLFNLWDEEIIQIGGSPIFYYEVFIQPQTVDPLYQEDRGKIWSNIPVELWAWYDPVEEQNFQTAFGLDSPDELVFELNYRAVLNKLGHPPKVGSRIYTPAKRENWEIIQRKVGEFKLWGELRLRLLCQRFQESTTTMEAQVQTPVPNFKIN